MFAPARTSHSARNTTALANTARTTVWRSGAISRRHRRFGSRILLDAKPCHVECWQEDQSYECTDQESAHDGEGHRTPEYRGGDRYQAENSRDRRQHDRTEAGDAGVDHRIPRRLAFKSLGLNLFDKNDGVPGDHADQRQNPQYGDEPEWPLEYQQSQHHARHRHRHDGKHQEQPAEALQLNHSGR